MDTKKRYLMDFKPLLRNSTQLPPPLWSATEIAVQTQSIANKIRCGQITVTQCTRFCDSDLSYPCDDDYIMSIISEPRLQRLKANNKLKATRLRRKAQLARIGRKKKAQEIGGLRDENTILKLRIEKLQKQIGNAKKIKIEPPTHSNGHENTITDEAIDRMEHELSDTPHWMKSLLTPDMKLNTDCGLNLSAAQQQNIQSMAHVSALHENLESSRECIRRLKCKRKEKLSLQQTIYERLKQILNKTQMSKLSHSRRCN